ncbi:PucR family transcriptional regulator [Bacillus norwichensis]|uniref:PucR family transcriptional regulator ligand-binding domain-containing protein n=1 Tax=Bacillus norwichensis TaxID=2762217 RepID=A0ABR8VLQ3_9BACI|nr:PucR family transcriptional regulator [Bacillus norwichensis]MBD8005361.1 PucR family transcriptional regulator ligand-binding domain-containing protein [Bacillus norwichensis]
MLKIAISIHNALQLPVMKKTRLVAGQRGGENSIKWVTIVEVLEDIGRLQPGEFLITTGFGLSENEEKLEVFHQLLKSKLLSGIAIYTSFYMKEIPASFIELANENDLPLIEIPTDINFSEITKAILEQIVNNQMHLLEQAENIHRELTNLILNDQSLTEVTERLAQLTSSHIVIFNEFYDTIYSSDNDNLTWNPVNGDEIDISKHLIASLKRESKVNFTFKNHISTVYPIIAKQSCYGWIVMTKPESDWQELDDIAIEQAAPIYAMEFLKKQAIEETQLRIQSNFIEDIFNKNYINERIIIDHGLKLGYDLTLNQSVFHLTFKHPEKIDVNLTDRLYHLTDQILGQKKKQHLIQTKLNSIIFLTNVIGETKEETYKHSISLAKDLLKNWTYYFPNVDLIIGIGKDYKQVDELGKSAQEAHYAVKLSDLVSKNVNIVHYDDLGMYDLLLEMERSGISLMSIYEQHMSGLLSNKEIDLIETLDSYFKNNQSIQKAAEELYIHRHTLRYRLNQIEIRTGLDIKSTEDLLKLQLGVMAYKLVNILKKEP